MRMRIGLWVVALTLLLFGTAACSHPPIDGDWGYHFREMRMSKYGGGWQAYDDGWVNPEDFSVPAIQPGKFNVAFVYVGDVATDGWTIAHDKGRTQVEAEVEGVHTAYLESVPEGLLGDLAMRQLVDAGFDAVITTSYGFEEALLELAAEFPDRYFVNVSGHLHNDTNMATLFGAMESARYLAGMAAGARAAADGSYRVGYIGSEPVTEIVRLANATALGMRRTCPNCQMDLEWTYAWFDPELEDEAANKLLDEGATVLVTGSDSLAPLLAAKDRDMHAIPSNNREFCNFAPNFCLGVPYWNWGQFYVSKIQSMVDGTFEAGHFYHEFGTGIAGFYGFMEGETPQPGIPDEAVAEIRAVLAEMQSGEFDRFDIFTGPLNDNQGNEVVPADVSLTQSDLEGIDGYWSERLNRPGCAYCMDWLVEGFVPGAKAMD